MKETLMQEYKKSAHKALVLAAIAVVCVFIVEPFIMLTPKLMSAMPSDTFAVLAWSMVGVGGLIVILCVLAIHCRMTATKLLRKMAIAERQRLLQKVDN